MLIVFLQNGKYVILLYLHIYTPASFNHMHVTLLYVDSEVDIYMSYSYIYKTDEVVTLHNHTVSIILIDP
jgi:hypothetical protein